MSTCKQSTEWIIKKEYGELSIMENVQLMSHLAICQPCCFFAYQNSLINKTLQEREAIKEMSLTSEEKEELLRSVLNRINE